MRDEPRRLDVLCVGEALVDFLPDGKGKRVRDVVRWTRCPGGSPANVAIGLSRLGASSAFLGVVGEDEFGAFLREALSAEGVEVAALRHTRQGKTGIVFVSIDDEGDRTFAFYRKGAAEFLLDASDVERAPLSSARIVHLGTNSLMLPAAAEAARRLFQGARERGCLTSCDPNLRLHLWEDPQILRRLVGELLRMADVVKVAEDEAEFCTGEKEPGEAALALARLGATLGVVTLGAAGAIYCFQGKLERVASPTVEAVDATGAGDGFVAGLLSKIAAELRRGRRLSTLDAAEVKAFVTFGCQVGSKVVTQLGAVAGLPRLGQL